MHGVGGYMDNRAVQLVCSLALRTGLISLVRRLEGRRGNLVRILCYHRIGDTAAEGNLLAPALVSASTEMFERQMQFLVENYRPVSSDDLLNALEAKEALHPQSVIVTFDDGYRDFLDIAWPILRRYQIPALLNLPTGFISSEDRLFWWDRLFQGISNTRCKNLNIPSIGNFPLDTDMQRRAAFDQLQVRIRSLNPNVGLPLVDTILHELQVIPQTAGLLLTWAEARLLRDQGCYLAAHTRDHIALSRVPREDALQQIRAGQQDMLRETGVSPPVLAYPYGRSQDLSLDLSRLLHKEGFKAAMTAILGFNDLPRADRMRLKRIVLSRYHTFAEFQLSLTGLYDSYYTLQRLIFRRS